MRTRAGFAVWMRRSALVRVWFGAFWIAALMVPIAGCVSEDELIVESPSVPTASDGTPLFTNLYIEFPAPSARWAAGDGKTLQLTTREANRAELAIVRGDFDRAPASVQEVDADFAREQVKKLYEQLVQANDGPNARACPLPVRVRLIRGDGVLLERQDCRGGAEWVRAASRMIAEFESRDRRL